METNWIAIGIVVIIGIVLIIFLVWKNLKDEKDVEAYFNNECSNFYEDEDELNDEK